MEKIKKSPYKYFALKCGIFFVIVFCLDFTIGNTLRYFYFKQQSGLEYRTTYSIEKTMAAVVVFGSSKANHHYQPNIFTRELNLSFYNAGRDGNFIFYHYAVLEGILKRYSPKIIILDFTRSEFSRDQNNYDRISALLPYYRTHKEMRNIIELKDPFEKIKLVSSIYPFNSLFLTIAAGNAQFNKTRMFDNKGYIPLMNEWLRSVATDTSSATYTIDSVTMNVYKSFIADCLRSKVSLYVICSPYFIKYAHTDSSIQLAQQIAKENGVPFLDYSENSTFIDNSKLFADPSHLNDNGAKIFSYMLADSIRKISNGKFP